MFKTVASFAVDFVVGTGVGTIGRLAADKLLDGTQVGRVTKVCVYATSMLASCYAAEKASEKVKDVLKLNTIGCMFDVKKVEKPEV